MASLLEGEVLYPSMRRQVFVWGAIQGVAVSVLAIIGIFIWDVEEPGGAMHRLYNMLSWIAVAVTVYGAIYYYRRTVEGGVLSFGKGLQVGLVATLVGSAIVLILEWIVYALTPGVIDTIRELALAEAFQVAEVANGDPELVERVLHFVISPGFLAFGSAIGNVFSGLLMSLLATTLLRRSTPSTLR